MDINEPERPSVWRSIGHPMGLLVLAGLWVLGSGLQAILPPSAESWRATELKPTLQNPVALGVIAFLGTLSWLVQGYYNHKRLVSYYEHSSALRERMDQARALYEASDAKKAWLALHAYSATVESVTMNAADLFHEGAYHIAADRAVHEIIDCMAEARSVDRNIMDKLWFRLIEHAKKLGMVVSEYRRYYDEDIGMEDDFLHYQLKPLGQQVLAVAGMEMDVLKSLHA